MTSSRSLVNLYEGEQNYQSTTCMKIFHSRVFYRRAISRCLRDELAVTRAIKTPAMINTLQPPPLINSPFRQGSQSVRTRIIKHLPSTLISVPPHHHINTQNFLCMWHSLVKITNWHQRVPLGIPIKFLMLGAIFNL